MATSRVYLGGDHAGFDLKKHLLTYLHDTGYEVVDCGASTFDPEDDYPSFCVRTGQKVVADPGSLGIVLGGSGNGEQIAANKVRGVRAALGWSVETARLAREHNNANVLGVGARMHSVEEATAIVNTFVTTDFSGAERHIRRIAELDTYERGAEVSTPAHS